jgi:hypothetical protein
MDRETYLLHQVHPAKLATDIAACRGTPLTGVVRWVSRLVT